MPKALQAGRALGVRVCRSLVHLVGCRTSSYSYLSWCIVAVCPLLYFILFFLCKYVFVLFAF